MKTRFVGIMTNYTQKNRGARALLGDFYYYILDNLDKTSNSF